MSAILNLQFQRVAPPTVRDIIEDWPVHSKKCAYELITKYDMPHEATPRLLIWYYNGPWKRTILHRDGASHNIPHHHVDILEQTVNEHIRPEVCSELSQFDGSIIVNRTRGELTAYCENEQANIFLLNLAHEIILGKRTSKQAKSELLRASDFFHSHLPNKYRDDLLFFTTETITDPDQVVADPN